MSEIQKSQKKNKKKKKQIANENSLQDSTKNNNEQLIKNEQKSTSEQKLNSVINEILPQKIGDTTKFKDVEVTLTNGANENNGTIKKKKKKKKKNKQQSIEDGSNAAPDETENQNLLNFTENHIELVNHPEISVTISNVPVPVEEPPKLQEKSNSISEQEAKSVEPATAENTKKKKKKKKKKKIQENSPPTPSAPTESVEDGSQSTPTYVKLPADGGNCVLLVSHESFSNGNKQTVDSSNVSTQNKTATVLLKKTESKEMENNTPSNSSSIQNNRSVSIFPVYSDSNKKQDKKPEFNVNSSLDKINNMIKNESETLPNEENTSEITNPEVSNNQEENKPTKAQLKAERRAKQEAQRAAKLEKNSEKTSVLQTKEENKKTNSKEQQPRQIPTNENMSHKNTTKSVAQQETCRKVHIFSHLPQHQDLLTKRTSNVNINIPPPIIELGSHYIQGTLCGSNARCVGFLAALRQIIIDYKTPPNKNFSKDFESKLPSYLDYLSSCRPLSVNIINSMKFLKHLISHIPSDMNEDKAKESLSQSINDYVREEILLAKEAITISTSAKIVNNDTILVFAYSSLVKEVLCKAYDQNKSFCVIIVDSRPKMEGMKMLRQLVKHGLQCCYVSINAVSSVIKKVNKVILGAHALLANGYVMSRLGCKIISLIGSTNSVPVMVCCETYKFWERSLTDSIVHNELGNPEDLVSVSLDKKSSLLNWNNLPALHIYNLLYDVTPSELISVVITEKGLIPCTSVPVLLRVCKNRNIY